MTSSLLHLVERVLSVLTVAGLRFFASDAALVEWPEGEGQLRWGAAGDERCRSPAADLVFRP